MLNAQFKFAEQFEYNDKSDRSIAIVGPAYLDFMLGSILIEFLVDDEKEVKRLLEPDGPLSTYGNRVTACYCLGFISDIVKSDLRLIGKIRNRFAHDLQADFSDPQIGNWCKTLRWHREFFVEPPADASDRDLFQVGVHRLASYLQGIVSIARSEKRSLRSEA